MIYFELHNVTLLQSTSVMKNLFAKIINMTTDRIINVHVVLHNVLLLMYIIPISSWAFILYWVSVRPIYETSFSQIIIMVVDNHHYHHNQHHHHHHHHHQCYQHVWVIIKLFLDFSHLSWSCLLVAHHSE